MLAWAAIVAGSRCKHRAVVLVSYDRFGVRLAPEVVSPNGAATRVTCCALRGRKMAAAVVKERVRRPW